MIIGICGLIGSGKNTVGDYLKNDKGYRQVSFAGALKDVVAVLFDWNRELLEGDTEESREFREKIDGFWSNRLDYEVTPRNMLQRMGTEIMRNNLDPDIWLHSLERKLIPGSNYVITDVRFPNEIRFLRDIGAKVIRVKRGEEPIWYDTALRDNITTKMDTPHMELYYPSVHISEWAWIGQKFDYIIENDSTLEELYGKVDKMLVDFSTKS